VRVFQQTLQNVSNPLSIAHDSGIRDSIVEHGRLALDTLSVERRGGTVLVFVNGRVVTELFIDRRVSDGQIFIASGLTAADIASMQKSWPEIGAKKRK
jgi:hypothetical protein